MNGRCCGGVFTSRPALIAAVVVWSAILLGCMSFSFGGKYCRNCAEDGMLCQEGELALGAGCIQQIYYPVPYASPPNLELENLLGHVVIREQCADFFRAEIHGSPAPPLKVRWKARGLRGVVPHVPVVPPPPTPPPDLPPPQPANTPVP